MVIYIGCLAGLLPGRADDDGKALRALFDERVSTVVIVEFFIQHEIEREPVVTVGLVRDDEGHVVLLEQAIPLWIRPDRLRDFKIRPLGRVEGEGWPAEYRGQSHRSGFHFVQVDSGHREALTPITRFTVRSPQVADGLWGIGIMPEDFEYQPYLLTARLGLRQALPWQVGFTQHPVASPGAPVFTTTGDFAGWAGRPITQEKVLFMGSERYTVGIQPVQESAAFLLAEEFLRYSEHIPASPLENNRPWLGVAGLQPVDREVARFLKLEDQSALVVSDVIKGSPAADASLRSRDIIVAVDGQRLPRLRPAAVAVRYFDLIMGQKMIGDKLELTVLREGKEVPVEVTLVRSPRSLKEAVREYFPRLGFSVREFLLFDNINQRLLTLELAEGVIVEFVRNNSPVSAAGLQPGDWIKEIDGRAIVDLDEAAGLLEAIDKDSSRRDLVILISRNNETKVLRAKLD